MIVSQIVAAANNNAIGKDGQMPWCLPTDMVYFKNITWGMPVIMGRKTFESLGKPLSGRKNIVITRQADWKKDGVVVVKDLDQAIVSAKETDAKEVFVIGGGEIYRLAFEKTDRIYLTRVNATPDADTFFPAIDESKWKLKSEDAHKADEKNQFDYSFQVWERKRI